MEGPIVAVGGDGTVHEVASALEAAIYRWEFFPLARAMITQ